MSTFLLGNISKIIAIIILIIILLVLMYLLFKSIKNKQSGSFLTHNTVTKWIDQDIEIVYINYKSYNKSIYLALSNNKRFIELMDNYNRTEDKNEREQIFNKIKNIFNICNSIINQFRVSLNNQLVRYRKRIKSYDDYLDGELAYDKIYSELKNRTINYANYSGFLNFVYTTQNSIISNNFFNTVRYTYNCPNCAVYYFYAFQSIFRMNLDIIRYYRDAAYPMKMGTNLDLGELFTCYSGGCHSKCRVCGNNKCAKYVLNILCFSFNPFFTFISSF